MHIAMGNEYKERCQENLKTKEAKSTRSKKKWKVQEKWFDMKKIKETLMKETQN